MGAKVTVKRIGPGAYDIHTPSGVYEIRNCPTDTNDPFLIGFRAGPRWMLTSPGRFSADSDFTTKRDAVTYVRTIEEEKANVTESPAACRHGNTPRPDATGDPITACANAGGGTEWGAFNAEGCPRLRPDVHAEGPRSREGRGRRPVQAPPRGRRRGADRAGRVPLRTGIFLAVSSDGSRNYRTHRAACSCPAGVKGVHVCKHRIAAHILGLAA